MADVTTGIKLEASGGEDFAKDTAKAAEDTAKLETALKNVEEAADKADKAVSGEGGDGGVAKSIDDLTTSALTAATEVMKLTANLYNLGNTLYQGANDFAERAKAIKDHAAQLGLSTQAYQELSWAIDGSNDSLIGLQSGFERLNRIKFGEIENGGIYLSDVGLEWNEVRLYSTAQLLTEVLDGLRAIEDQDERLNAATNLFGASVARKLLPALRMSDEEIAETVQQMRDYHVLWDDAMLDNAEAYLDQTDEFLTPFHSISDQFYASLLEPLQKVRQAMLDFFNENWDWDRFDSFVDAFSNKFITFAEYIAEHGNDIAETIKLIGEAWLTWKGYTILKTAADSASVLYTALTAIAGALGISAGAVAGAGVAVAAGVYTTFDHIKSLDYGGLLGAGHTLDEYLANAAARKEELDQFHATYDEYMQSGYTEGLEQLAFEEAELAAAYRNAKEEAEKAAAAAAEANAQLNDSQATDGNAAVQAQTENWDELAAAEGNATVTGAEAMDAFNTMVDDLNAAEAGARTLETVAGEVGTISSEFVDGVDDMSQAAADSVKSTNEVMAANMGVLSGNMFVWGVDMMKSFSDGLISGFNSFIAPAIALVAGELSAQFEHSEPDKGPLSNDSTWMPDMMKSFAEGIRDNRYLVLDEMGALARGMETSFDPTLGMPGGGSSVSYGGVTVVFEVQDGQDGRALFEEFSAYLEAEIAQEEATFAS